MADVNETALVVSEKAELTVDDVVAQAGKIQRLMQSIMKKGEHYGVIPGTNGKPTLLKPGAEKLGFTFRLAPKFEVTRHDLEGDHREYEVLCTLVHLGTSAFVAQGVGLCTSMEKKYRYRVKWTNGAKTREANPDIADTYNTVLKMAKKRAHVDAMITACAASDIFTQDVEDVAPPEPRGKPAGKQQAKPSDKPTTERSTILKQIGVVLKTDDIFTEEERENYRERLRRAEDLGVVKLILEEARKVLAERRATAGTDVTKLSEEDKAGVDQAWDGKEDGDEQKAEPTKAELDIF